LKPFFIVPQNSSNRLKIGGVCIQNAYSGHIERRIKKKEDKLFLRLLKREHEQAVGQVSDSNQQS